jgi:hypothetical protein
VDNGGIAPLLNSALDVNGQLHASADVPRGNSCSTCWVGAGWAAEPFWTLWRGEKSCLCRESNPDRAARSHTDWATIKPQDFLVNWADITFSRHTAHHVEFRCCLYSSCRTLARDRSLLFVSSTLHECHCQFSSLTRPLQSYQITLFYHFSSVIPTSVIHNLLCFM